MRHDNCHCGHSWDAHQHFRPGSDCGQCGAELCPAYRPAGGRVSLLRRLLRRFG